MDIENDYSPSLNSAELEEQSKNLKAKEKSLKDVEQNLNEIQQNLIDKEAELEQRESLLEKKEKQLAEKQAQMNIQEEELKNKTEIVREKQKLLEQKLEEVKVKEKSLFAQNEILKKDTTMLNSQKSESGKVSSNSSLSTQVSLHYDCASSVSQIKNFEPVTVLSLKDEYKNELILARIHKLSQKYSALVKARGDGNCFYRSFGFLFCKYVTSMNPCHDVYHSLFGILQKYPKLDSLGRQLIDDFIKSLQNPQTNRTICDRLLQNEKEMDEILIKVMRMLTVVGLNSNKSEYSFYSALEFENIVKEAATNGVEAEQIHITALCKVLQLVTEWKDNISLLIIQISRDTLYHYDPLPVSTPCQGKEKKEWTLLFRPGHYDILLDDASLCIPSVRRSVTEKWIGFATVLLVGALFVSYFSVVHKPNK